MRIRPSTRRRPARLRSLAGSLALGFALCANAAQAAEPSGDDVMALEPEVEAAAPATTEVVEIGWEDLMPVGEEERLSELYEAFFQELEEKMKRSSPMMLGDFSAAVAEGSAADTMPQIGTFNVVPELDGQAVRLPGYVVPLDFDAKDEHREFLLVPYFGACLHTPPPPPNQIVYVTSEPATKIEDIWQPVWIEGVVSTGEFKNGTGDAAYKIALTKFELYDY